MHANLALQQRCPSSSLRAPERGAGGMMGTMAITKRFASSASLARATAPMTTSGRHAEDLAPAEAPCTSASTSTSSTRRAAIVTGLALATAAVAGPSIVAPRAANAADADAEPSPSAPSPSAPSTPSSSSSSHPRVYLDVRIDGEPAGRIEIELLPEAAPVGARRFADLAEEKGGVGYRLAKWDGIFIEKGYLRCSGAKALSYKADGTSEISGGDSTLDLEREMDDATGRRLLHDRAGLVSLVVREAEARPVKERLVAMGGKLVTLTSQAGEAPNGSAFCVTLGPAPELDRTNLVVGRLIPGPGTDTAVAALAALPVNRPREGIQKPFFDAGKAMGDSRAVVAEKGFFRPLKRAVISDSGAL